MGSGEQRARLRDLIERGERAQRHSRELIEDLDAASSSLRDMLTEVRGRRAALRAGRAASQPRPAPGSRDDAG